ncbi:hypothetical protein Tsubulata_019438 [Turnera subulata]|uniref:DNA-directed RNA polymerase subunit beta n=1 Tax=Turnera subulata TaxID=218843 RepID=A0A9Q0J2Z7_9ROSI|nr:hypothetical protein Tsubulata_019438 [Turnera subulata]
MEADASTSIRSEQSLSDFDDMDIDDDDFVEAISSIRQLGEGKFNEFCKKAARLFFDKYGLISHQINSYNEFIRTGLQRLIDSLGDLHVVPDFDPSKKGDGEWKYATIKFGNVKLEQPKFWSNSKCDNLKLLPKHARLQKMTYSAKIMTVSVTLEVYTQKRIRSDKFKTGMDEIVQKDVIKTETKDITTGRLPVMVKSDLYWMATIDKPDCDFDLGGYFLINGAEKSPLKEKRKYSAYFLSTQVPLWILFFSLGVTSDKQVVDLIDFDVEDASIRDVPFASLQYADDKCENFRKGRNALDYLAKQIAETKFPPPEPVEECIGNYLFPNLLSSRQKARFLGYMVKCIFQVYTGRRNVDNRDSFRNKRLDLAGELFERELRRHILHSRKRMAKALQRDLPGDRDVREIEHYMDATIVTNGIKRAFSTGAWSHAFKRTKVSGVVAYLERTNPLQTIMHLRKMENRVNYKGKVGDARYQHPSHWGRVCFLSTPDNEKCGLVKNLAITGLVSTDLSESVVDKLFECGMAKVVDDTHTKLSGKSIVFLNGQWVGVCNNSQSFVAVLRHMRRTKELPHQVEIKRDEQQKEVRIFTDSGRILRPLLVVANLNKIKTLKDFTFDSLLDEGVIEFIGTEEEEDCRTAWGLKDLLQGVEGNQPMKYTHCELDMSFILGLSCGIIPFANHNHAKRVLYQAQKHSQQAIGFSTTNPNIRVDTLSHQLHYPQRPLFRTMTSDCLGKPGYPLGHNGITPRAELFNGQNAIVAVNVHLGYNQEDSLVMNRASVERGMFRSEHIRTYWSEADNNELDRKGKNHVSFGKVQSTFGRVDSLDEDGFPIIRSNLQSGDIVIGRCAESGAADHSIKLKQFEGGIVQKVVLSSNDEGKNFAAVSLRQVRAPSLGDKFTSMHGQKGVVGFLDSQENFPFTIQGIVPDIVINPHAFPSRQTVGQLLEAALGKGIACGGTIRHATPFSTPSNEDIMNQLHRAGFSRWGHERVYNGRTGEKVSSLIFMGPTFYQRLNKMAADQVKFRSTGRVHPHTRQPVKDRKLFGGVKFGEMERDCLIAHGAAANLHERLFTLSDASHIHVCQKCQNIANVALRSVPGGRKIRGPYCRICESADDIVKVDVPYGAKLLTQELFSVGITLNDRSEQLHNGFDDMDIDDDGYLDASTLLNLGEKNFNQFCRKTASLFFDKYGLIGHQINSYNEFVRNGLQKLVVSLGDMTVDPDYDPSKKGDSEWKYATLKFGKIRLERPSFWANSEHGELNLLPRHARLQNMTYSAQMVVNVTVEVYTQKRVRSDKFKTGMDEIVQKDVIKTETKDITIGRLPVMVKSDLCWMTTINKTDCDFDHGGYFLIKGAEKVLVAQERLCTKRLWITNIPCWTISYRSEYNRSVLSLKLVEFDKMELVKGEKKAVSVYFLATQVPLWILLFALGVRSDKEVFDLIDFEIDDVSIRNALFASIQDADEKCEDFRKGRNALDYFGKQIKETKFPPSEPVEACISNYLFPSLQSPRQKARFLGYMVKSLFQAYTGRRKFDNRDSFRNKRLELAGELLERELRVHILHSRRRMAKALQKDLHGDRDVREIEHYMDACIVTNGMTRAFSTGAWSHPYKKMERTSGVVANLGHANPLQTMVDLRKMRHQVPYTGKVGDARYPHPSHWGRVCFLSTPDGENCGLVKNLAITGLVSTDLSEPVVEKLFECGMDKVVDDVRTKLGGKDKVFLNGLWVGVCNDSCPFVAELRHMRRTKELPHQVEIKRDEQQKEVRIFTDAGRILRPLLVVENLHKIKAFKDFTFDSLLDEGVIEFIGAEEEEDCRTAWGFKFLLQGAEGNQPVRYTHCELDMVLYQAQKHSQQAIGFSTTNPNIRVDTLSHQLHYPQRPLFRTITSDCLGKPGYPLGHNGITPRAELFNGQNAIVAVNVHLGYNQEDSLVMNRASLERGMFRSEHVRSYKSEVDNSEVDDKKRKGENRLSFGKIQSTFGRVDSLDDDGFPFVGANLQAGDIVIGRCAESGADHCVKLKHTERGMVQKVVLSSNDEGKNFAVVSLRQVRPPCLGDKFSSMHGQKGVLGFLDSQENFPFTTQGIVPDIVINPHAFPSRQTPGQLLEAALGKGIACGGMMRYATPFSTPSVEDITNQLHRAGFSRWGQERVYNGRTGEQLRSLIFMGPTFYQRLIHMAEDKVKFRNTGPVHPLTRQPVTDRKRFGGIKFGEMERDCLIAHGATANLHERLFTLSDSSAMHVCQKCQNVANVIQRSVPGGRKIRGPYCRICESVDDIVKVNVPYGAKLLSQELFSMGITLKVSNFGGNFITLSLYEEELLWHFSIFQKYFHYKRTSQLARLKF